MANITKVIKEISDVFLNTTANVILLTARSRVIRCLLI